jgi:bacterioferritin (cytochrome b1)
MTDLLLDLVDKAIEKELKSSIRYVWQYLMVQKSDIKDDFRANAIKKLEQVMRIGDHLFDLGEFPASTPEDIGRSRGEMIDIDLKAENEVIKIFQEIIGEAAKEEDEVTRKLFEKILTEEKERKSVLMCARGRATKKII